MNFRRAFLSLMLFFLVVPMGVALLPDRANAAAFGLVPCALKNDDPSTTGWDERAPCTLCHFMIGFQRIISLLRNIMTAIAIAVIVAMAIVYITSAGDEGRMSFAKEGIKWSLIGFAVILLAWVIVNFLFTLPIFANNGLVRTGWDTLSCNVTSQVGWTAAKSSSGIANTSGSTNNGPNRYGLPGATFGTGTGGSTGGTGSGSGPGGGDVVGSCNNNGVCEYTTSSNSENCTSCPGDCGACTANPVCGSTYPTCVAGTPDSVGSCVSGDSCSWDCLGGVNRSSPFVTCIQYLRDSVCGNNKVEGSEQCDTGAARGACPYTCSGLCQTNNCSNASAPTALACGPSNGSNDAPTEPLCLGTGAVASLVATSKIGTITRYDWTCSVPGSGYVVCSSTRLVSSGGE